MVREVSIGQLRSFLSSTLYIYRRNACRAAVGADVFSSVSYCRGRTFFFHVEEPRRATWENPREVIMANLAFEAAPSRSEEDPVHRARVLCEQCTVWARVSEALGVTAGEYDVATCCKLRDRSFLF